MIVILDNQGRRQVHRSCGATRSPRLNQVQAMAISKEEELEKSSTCALLSNQWLGLPTLGFLCLFLAALSPVSAQCPAGEL